MYVSWNYLEQSESCCLKRLFFCGPMQTGIWPKSQVQNSCKNRKNIPLYNPEAVYSINIQYCIYVKAQLNNI